MTEIKFYVPPASNYHNGEEGTTSVEALHKQIKAHSSISEVGAGSGIVSFPEVPIVAPRGKFDLELYGEFRV